jgi:hypothetical protein
MNLSPFSNKNCLTKQIVLPISDCKDNVVDSSFLDDVVHFGLGVSGHVFPVDLKDLLKKILLKIVKSRNINNNMPEY